MLSLPPHGLLSNQCRHLNMQASEHYDKVVFTVDFRPVLLDLLGYCIYWLVRSNDSHLTRGQQCRYLLDYVRHMLDCSNRVGLILQQIGKSDVMLTLNGFPLFCDG